MKYIVTACSHEHLEKLLETDLDGFVIGESMLSLRLPYTYALDELKNVIKLIKSKGKIVYVDMHTMITRDHLAPLDEAIALLKDEPIDGIIFADPAVYQVAKEQSLNIPLVLSTETMTTNWYNVDYWNQKGIHHVALAKELTKRAIKSINKNVSDLNVELEVQAFGPLSMFHSRRTLLDNYYKHLEKLPVDEHHLSFLFDKERNNYYQIFEDKAGTHIMSAKDVCAVEELDFFDKLDKITYLKLDALGHDEETMNQVYGIFIEARKLFLADPQAYAEKKKSFFEEIQTLYKPNFRGIDTGFLYKPTIY